MIRLVLAATLGATYGIYGPPFEQCVGTPVRHGSEEYLDSEKYQIRHWDLDAPWSLRDYIARINEIRRENPALHYNRNLRFFDVDNEAILCYGKSTPDQSNLILVIVNLDPYHTQSGWIHLPVHELSLGSDPGETFQVHDLISDARFLWHGESNFVQLDPHVSPAHILRVRRRIRTEARFRLFHVNSRPSGASCAPSLVIGAPVASGDSWPLETLPQPHNWYPCRNFRALPSTSPLTKGSFS